MTFWNGEKLAQRLPKLITPYDRDRIDCAAYTLSVGHEVYVSPTDQTTTDPQQQTVRSLAERECFTIPPGQFAFLLTDEVVSVPADALAFISMKAKIKFRGLINVSGFHVDPGFKGKLIFAVFNAGPVVVHLRRGDPCFLIWFAELNSTSEYIKRAPEQIGIPTELINVISGELHSFEGLAKKIKDVEKSLTDRIHIVERDGAILKVMAGIVFTVTVGFLVALFKQWLLP
jgi:dCTP deaminase